LNEFTHTHPRITLRTPCISLESRSDARQTEPDQCLEEKNSNMTGRNISQRATDQARNQERVIKALSKITFLRIISTQLLSDVQAQDS
jgi:hypothetical protein